MARIAVIGAGLMGHGIAQVFAQAGHDVAIHDQSAQALATVRDRVAQNLRVMGLPPDAAARIKLCDHLEDAVSDVEVVFEAAFEDLAVKRGVFTRIEESAPPGALVATNTSVMTIGDVTALSSTRERMLGTHWWNPPHLIPLVEVVQGECTDPQAVERMLALLREVGKSPVHVRRDVPGFVGNRLQHALWREALALVDEGVCDPETVDQVVKTSFGLRLSMLGPIENADLVGLDLTRAIHAYLLPHLSRAETPSRTMDEHIEKGELGMKTGQGMREWPPGTADAVRSALSAHLVALAAGRGA